MTLTYLGPHRDEGGLIVPYGAGEPPDPLVAEMSLLLRASEIVAPTNGWASSSDNWPNEGTTGATVDAESDGGTPVFIPATVPVGVFGYHWNTNSTASITTPDSSAIDVSGDIDLRAEWVTTRDRTDLENRSPAIARITGLDSGTPGYDGLSYELSIYTEDGDGVVVGNVGLIWVDSGNVQRALNSTGHPPLDPYELNEVRVTLDVDDGGEHTARFYVRDDDDPDVTTEDDKGWRLLGSPISSAGTTSIRDTSGPLTVASFDCAVAYAEVYDGIDGTLVADFNPGRDSTGPILENGTLTSATSGEVWTVRGASVITTGNGQAHFLMTDFARFTVPDHASIDLGTADGSWAFLFTPSEIADTDNDIFTYAAKVAGPLGAGGSGWQLWDAKIDGYGIDGFGVLGADGGGPFLAMNNTFTAARHCVVVNYDRAGNATVYVDNTAQGTADISAVGSLSNAADLVIGNQATVWYLEAVAFIPRILDAEERARVPDVLVNA